MATFSVKNFERYQHYKDRSPPWIKLYNDVLDDYQFGLLPDAAKAHLFAIWLLASRYNNEIPYDAEWVSRRINATETVDLQALAESGFIVLDQSCSITLADCKQDACLETETETETEKEICTKPRRARISYPQDFEEFWKAYPPDPLQSKKEALAQWSKLTPEDRSRAIKAVPAFAAYCRANPDYRPVHACRFLSQRRFEGFDEAPPTNGAAEFVRIHSGTPQWDAWVQYRTAKGERVDFMVRRGEWQVPSEWPPKQECAA